jgi:DNA-binding XRE family transcriptional regulator
LIAHDESPLALNVFLLLNKNYVTILLSLINVKSNRVTTFMKIQSDQCRMARTALRWGVRDLAEKAEVSPNTIARFERGEKLHDRTVVAIQNALESGGIEFIPENGGGAGVRFRERGD